MALPSFDDSLRILALKAVHDTKDWESVYRRVCRWYSKTFHTPLHQVLDLDEAFVLMHYYEDSYERLDEDDWRKQVREAIETPEEKSAREQEEALADEAALAVAAATAAKQAKTRRRGPQTMAEAATDNQKEFEQAADKLKAALDGLPQYIEPVKKVGDKVKEASSDQILLPGFAPDAFKRLSETEKMPDEEIPMGLPEPPPIPRRPKPKK